MKPQNQLSSLSHLHLLLLVSIYVSSGGLSALQDLYGSSSLYPWDSIRFNRPRPPFAKTSAPGQTHEALATRQRFLSQLNAHHQEALSAAQ